MLRPGTAPPTSGDVSVNWQGLQYASLQENAFSVAQLTKQTSLTPSLSMVGFKAQTRRASARHSTASSTSVSVSLLCWSRARQAQSVRRCAKAVSGLSEAGFQHSGPAEQRQTSSNSSPQPGLRSMRSRTGRSAHKVLAATSLPSISLRTASWTSDSLAGLAVFLAF